MPEPKKWKIKWIDQCLYLYRFMDGYSNTTFTKNKSIQDHLELGRRNYAAEFDAFNQKRLAAERPKPPPDIPNQTVPSPLSFTVRTSGTARPSARPNHVASPSW